MATQISPFDAWNKVLIDLSNGLEEIEELGLKILNCCFGKLTLNIPINNST